MNDEEAAAENPAADPERERIARYVVGLADPAEARGLEARLVTDEALRLEVDALRAIWEHAAPAFHLPLADADRERAWRRLSQAIREPVLSSPAPDAARPRRVPRWRRPLLAASMLAAALLAAVLLLPTRRAGPPPPGPSAISRPRP